MPVWHESAKPLVAADQLQIVGIVQEQHAERTRLYAQWKQFEFPIAQDATTSLDLNAVPIAVLIDEHGVVRNNSARPQMLAEFVSRDYEPIPESTLASSNGPELAENPAEKTRSDSEKLIANGNEVLNFNRDSKLDEAINAFDQATRQQPSSGKAWFSLGVAYRMRYDSRNRQADDFNTAARCWSKALSLDPNQYIWRRRIEQYGPPQSKPYPFYNWIDQATDEIARRREMPLKLTVPVTASETATPSSNNANSNSNPENPDPNAEINSDEENLITLNSALVRLPVQADQPLQVHVELALADGKFNAEAGPIEVWIDESSNGQPELRRMKFDFDPDSAQDKIRSFDFGFKPHSTSEEGAIKGFLLCHICDEEGVCYYLRKNFVVAIPAQQ